MKIIKGLSQLWTFFTKNPNSDSPLTCPSDGSNVLYGASFLQAFESFSGKHLRWSTSYKNPTIKERNNQRVLLNFAPEHLRAKDSVILFYLKLAAFFKLLFLKRFVAVKNNFSKQLANLLFAILPEYLKIKLITKTHLVKSNIIPCSNCFNKFTVYGIINFFFENITLHS